MEHLHFTCIRTCGIVHEDDRFSHEHWRISVNCRRHNFTKKNKSASSSILWGRNKIDRSLFRSMSFLPNALVQERELFIFRAFQVSIWRLPFGEEVKGKRTIKNLGGIHSRGKMVHCRRSRQVIPSRSLPTSIPDSLNSLKKSLKITPFTRGRNLGFRPRRLSVL